MHRFKNIAVIIDLKMSNEIALGHAVELAKTNQATLSCLCPTSSLLQDEHKAMAKNNLSKIISIDFECVFLTGKPIIAITEYAHKHDIDMIIIEPEVISRINQFFYGSLTLSLMRKAPCPVWATKKPASEGYQRILVAVDYDENNSDPAFNDKLIQIGTSYAKRQQAEYILVTAWQLHGESSLRGPFIHTSYEDIEELKAEQKTICAESFEKIWQRNNEKLQGCKTEMLEGDPGQVIAEFARKKQIDLIVMGTLARSGIRGFVLGNTAETILNQVTCSIMAIKPDGFISPILSS